jgi:hypothetical protein
MNIVRGAGMGDLGVANDDVLNDVRIGRANVLVGIECAVVYVSSME